MNKIYIRARIKFLLSGLGCDDQDDPIVIAACESLAQLPDQQWDNLILYTRQLHLHSYQAGIDEYDND